MSAQQTFQQPTQIFQLFLSQLLLITDPYSLYLHTITCMSELFLFCRCLLWYQNPQKNWGLLMGYNRKISFVSKPSTAPLFAWVMKNSQFLASYCLPFDFRVKKKQFVKKAFLLYPAIAQEQKAPNAIIGLWSSIELPRFSKENEELFFCLATNLEIALHNMELYQEATRDYLTGLYHRNYFFECLQQAIAKPEETISCLMIDVDFFKLVNDVYGHTIGDEILQELSYLLQQLLPPPAVLARYGGEEFAVLLYDTAYDIACAIAENVRIHVSQQIFAAQKKPICLTVSIGVAEFHRNQVSQDFLFQLDCALYRAKNQGRNQIA